MDRVRQDIYFPQRIRRSSKAARKTAWAIDNRKLKPIKRENTTVGLKVLFLAPPLFVFFLLLFSLLFSSVGLL